MSHLLTAFGPSPGNVKLGEGSLPALLHSVTITSPSLPGPGLLHLHLRAAAHLLPLHERAGRGDRDRGRGGRYLHPVAGLVPETGEVQNKMETSTCLLSSWIILSW